MVELAKAMTLEDNHHGHLVILLDEPTSVLERTDINLLFDRVRALKARASFVFVSHRIDEVWNWRTGSMSWATARSSASCPRPMRTCTCCIG